MTGLLQDSVRSGRPAGGSCAPGWIQPCRRGSAGGYRCRRTDYLHACKREGLHYPTGRCPARRNGGRRRCSFPWPDVDAVEAKLAQADKHSNAGMLRERYKYCERVVKGSTKSTSCADRQVCWWTVAAAQQRAAGV